MTRSPSKDDDYKPTKSLTLTMQVPQDVTPEMVGQILEKYLNASLVRPCPSPVMVLHQLVVWDRLREKAGISRREDFEDHIRIDAEHSMRGGLLGRLLSGKQPLPHPPPCAYSRPWYSLIDSGDEGVKDVLNVWMDLKNRPDEVVIEQFPWKLIEVLEEERDFIVEPQIKDHRWRYKRGEDTNPYLDNPWGQWRLTWIKDSTWGKNHAEWHLRPLRDEDGNGQQEDDGP